jgi:hypothetical protein
LWKLITEANSELCEVMTNLEVILVKSYKGDSVIVKNIQSLTTFSMKLLGKI